MMLLALVFTTIPAWAIEYGSIYKKIVVIADPHVMAPSLLTNPDNPDWQAYVNADRKLIDKSKVLFDQAIENIKTNERPNLVLIVGDLTKDGEKASHIYVKNKLDELRNKGIPSLVIPGNHDFGTAGAKIYGETTSPAETITKDEFATLYENYGYGNNSGNNYDRLENTLIYSCEPIDGLMVFGVDTGTDGKLSESTLDWICLKAAASRAIGKQVIVMMHHPLIPHITGGEAFSETVSVYDYETVRNRLADSGVCAVFSGHFHTSDIAMDWNADKTKFIYDVNTGSLCSYPCDYRVVTVDDDWILPIDIMTETVTGNMTISAEDAKTRLKTSITNLLKAKIKAKLIEQGQNEFYASFASDYLAPKLASAYIYHAEGDEKLNEDAQALLADLNTTLASYPTYQNLVNSMLQDKSNYGDAYRENQTNDRIWEIDYSSDIDFGDILSGFYEGSGTENSPYIIKTETQFNLLSNIIKTGNKLNNIYFKLGNDITVSKMVGDYYNAFGGHFDGDGYTLTFNYTTDLDYAAPFASLKGATIENLHVDGTINTSKKFAAGIAAYTSGTNNITNCRSSIVINSSMSDEGTHGGFVGLNKYDSKLTITDCVFDGKLLTTNGSNRCGGFVGYTDEYTKLDIKNSIYAPVALADGETWCNTTQSATFARYYDWSTLSISETYYTTEFNDGDNYLSQGEPISISGNCGQTGIDGSDVTWSYDRSSKTLTISGTGAMMYYGLTNNYLHSTSPWSLFDFELEHVVIENGVTSVGAYAFAMCGHLTSVSLPSTVFQIDQAAFYTSSLARIDIPRIETVSLAQNAFDYCPEGLSIVVPSTLLKTYQTANNWSTYADKLVGSLSEATGFNTTTFVTGKYEFKRTLRCGVSSTICLPFGISAEQAASVGKFYSFEGVDKSGEWTVIMKEDVNEVTNGLVAYKPYLFVPYIFDGKNFGDEFEFTFSGSVSSLTIAGSVNKEEDKYYGSFWSFQGVFYDVVWDENHNSYKLGKIYGFAANSYDGGSYTVNPGDFVKAGVGARIVPFRAYLEYTGPSSQSAQLRGGTDEPLPNSMKVKLINADGGVTAVGKIDMETGDIIIDTWTDMNGRILPGAPVEGGMYIHNGKQVLIKY